MKHSTMLYVTRFLPLLLALAAASPAQPASAQRTAFYKNSSPVKSAFRPVVSSARRWVVQVECEVEKGRKKDVALGTIVDAGGYILTKASELSGSIVCKVPGKGHHQAKIVGVSEPYDLALLKIDADNLPAARWNTSPSFSAGQWVVAASEADTPLAVGVVSVPRRQIARRPGLLGVMIAPGNDGPRVTSVVRGSAAEKAGLKMNDEVTHVNGKATATREVLVRTVQSHNAGSRVRVTFLRGDEEKRKFVVEAVLDSPQPSFQDRIGGPLSRRSAGFPTAFQHDTVFKPHQCGGPLLDLQGKAMGINIARAGRVISYAIPASVVVDLLKELKSGKLKPAGLAAAGQVVR